MSVGMIDRGAPNFSFASATAFASAIGGGAQASAASSAGSFGLDSFQPAKAQGPAQAGAAAAGGGMDQIVGALEKVVQALTKVVGMLKEMLGGGQGEKAGGKPGGGAPGGAAGPGGPGGAPKAEAPGGAQGTKGGERAGSQEPTRGPSGQSPIDIARSVAGKNASELKVNGRLSEEMEDWVPNNVNCANFVSAVLQEAGQISKGQHSASVATLRGNLEKDPQFQKTSIQNAKPGDVVIMDTGRGENSHVVIFAGMKNGKPTFIGSNNVNPDGSQKVVEGPMGSRITGVYSYRG